jgi:class 3 adenylate cyclase
MGPEEFRRHLADAHGESCQALAMFLDVRGFSTFAGVAESSDTALFLRSMYSRILDSYFPEADFVKPTGDGLLLIRELTTDLAEVTARIRAWVQRGLDLVQDFASLTDDDLLITIPVPRQVGIGLARGSVSKLVSPAGVIDYSGRCLNLAARLMDFARPEGVTLQDRHAEALLGPELFSKFRTEEVFIRSIAEELPVAIQASKNNVAIRDSARQPIRYEPSFETSQTYTAKHIRATKGPYLVRLQRPPRQDATIKMACEFPTYNAANAPTGTVSAGRVNATLVIEPDGNYARVSFVVIAKMLDRGHVPDSAQVKLTPYH